MPSSPEVQALQTAMNRTMNRNEQDEPKQCHSTRKECLFTREDVESKIAQGAHIFILNNKVINANSFIKFHPGGHLPIKHMVGRDATDEVTAYVQGPRNT